MYTLPLDALNRTDLALAGGKGANLGALIQAGLPVPPGFCVTTAGYREFVAANGLAERIQALVERFGDASCLEEAALEEASAAIRALFAQGRMPEDIAAEACAAYSQSGWTGAAGGANPPGSRGRGRSAAARAPQSARR